MSYYTSKICPGRTSEKWRLEQVPLVADWLDWVAEKRGESEKTRQNYLIVLHAFCEFTGETPEQLVKQAKKSEEGRKDVHRLISRYMKAIRRKGYAASTVRLHVMILRCFFASQDVVFKSLKSPAGGARAPAMPLAPEEIEQVLKVVDVGDRALVYLLAHSGVRVGAVPRLTMGDLEEDKVPARLRAYDEKKNVPHDTFLASKALEALKDYFGAREIGTGRIPREKLTAESPLIRARKSFRPMTQREIHKR